MTLEEARRILAKVACHCDGYGVVPGSDGVSGFAVPCPDCDGKFVSNAQLKEARQVVAQHD